MSNSLYKSKHVLDIIDKEMAECVRIGNWGPAEAMRQARERIELLECEVYVLEMLINDIKRIEKDDSTSNIS